MLVRKTIRAPVVILDSQGPQQQGWVTDRNHNILGRLHHIVTMMCVSRLYIYSVNVNLIPFLIHRLIVGVQWLFRTFVNK